MNPAKRRHWLVLSTAHHEPLFENVVQCSRSRRAAAQAATSTHTEFSFPPTRPGHPLPHLFTQKTLVGSLPMFYFPRSSRPLYGSTGYGHAWYDG